MVGRVLFEHLDNLFFGKPVLAHLVSPHAQNRILLQNREYFREQINSYFLRKISAIGDL